MGATPINAGQTITAPLLNSRLPVGAFSSGSAGNVTGEQGIGQLTIPANDATQGSVYHLFIKGSATAAGAVNTLTWRVRFDAVVGGFAIMGAVAVTPSGAVTKGWYIDTYLYCLGGGAGGIFDVANSVGTELPATRVVVPGLPLSGGSVATHDTTIPIPVIVTTQWNAAAAGQATNTDFGFCERIA